MNRNSLNGVVTALVFGLLATAQSATAFGQSKTSKIEEATQTKTLKINRSRQVMGIKQLKGKASQTDILRKIRDKKRRSDRIREIVEGLYGKKKNSTDPGAAMGSKKLRNQNTRLRLIAPPLPEEQETVKLIRLAVPDDQAAAKSRQKNKQKKKKTRR